jgi:glycosyltransferase involved in cell wall biosynthesis
VTSRATTLRLCGDWSATTGLAEAARRLAVALIHEGAHITVSTFASGAPREDFLFPAELEPIEDCRDGCLSLWTLNINELHQVPDEEFGGGVYSVARWFWEFPTVPNWMLPQFERVSEIWAPSRFVRRAMMRYTQKPVLVIPPVVPVFRVESGAGTVRGRLGISSERVVFLMSFDYNSTVSRKNPFGVVDAFARAFSGTSASRPLLVIKVINMDKDSAFAARLIQEANRVGAVVIDRHMTSRELAALFHASDVYVSLHRSEGFGLGLAESMAIGKPVIGTAYSGNLDFMSVHNSCLVGYRLRPVDDTDYLYNRGMADTYVRGGLWAEPDVDQAAAWMDILASDEAYRKHIGEQAAHTIASRYSEKAVAHAALARLAQLCG